MRYVLPSSTSHARSAWWKRKPRGDPRGYWLLEVNVARARSGTSYGDRDSSAIPRATARDGSAAPPTATQSTARIPREQSQSMFRSLPSPVTATLAMSRHVFRAGTVLPSDNYLSSCTARKPVRGIDPHRDPQAYAAQKSGSRRRSGSCTGIDKAVVLSPPLLPCRALSAISGLAWALVYCRYTISSYAGRRSRPGSRP